MPNAPTDHISNVMATWRGGTKELAYIQCGWKLQTELNEFMEPFGKRLFKRSYTPDPEHELEELGDVSYYYLTFCGLYQLPVAEPPQSVPTPVGSLQIMTACSRLAEHAATICRLVLESPSGYIFNRAFIIDRLARFGEAFMLLLNYLGYDFEDIRAGNYAKLTQSPDNNGWSRHMLLSYKHIFMSGDDYLISGDVVEMWRDFLPDDISTNNDIYQFLIGNGVPSHGYDSEADCYYSYHNTFADAVAFVDSFNRLAASLGGMVVKPAELDDIIQSAGVVLSSMQNEDVTTCGPVFDDYIRSKCWRS